VGVNAVPPNSRLQTPKRQAGRAVDAGQLRSFAAMPVRSEAPAGAGRTMLVAWVRVLAGDIRDPLVGREALIGCATGVAAAVLTALNRVTAWQSGNPVALLVPDWHMLNGTSQFIGAVLAQFANGLFVSLFVLFHLASCGRALGLGRASTARPLRGDQPQSI
jgi:hypothetical protein